MPSHSERFKFPEVENDGQEFIRSILTQCKVHDVSCVGVEGVLKMGVKDVIAQQLVGALQLIERQHMLIVNQRGQIRHHLSDLNSTKSDIIRLQEEVIKTAKVERIEIDDEIVDRLSTAVQNSVETGIGKTYSDVVKSSVSTSAVIPKETLKTVAEEIAAEEEMSRNIMVFGLSEDENERLDEKVTEIFEQLGEKPRIESRRLGKKKSSSDIRPVKVLLSSSNAVQQILANSRKLRRTDKFKDVFLSPDRTPDQRIKHKELVNLLKEKLSQEPQMRHFIRAGQICSVEKSVNEQTE